MKKVEYQVMYSVEDDFWWYVGGRRAVVSILDTVLAGRRDLRILDAGSGTGANLKLLERYGRPVGIDLSSDAIAFSQRRGTLTLSRGSVSELPFADESFDLVTTFEVIYHLAVNDDRVALAEMVRVLRPGGYLLVRVPSYNWLRGSHDKAVLTRHRYTTGELRRKVESVGLRPVRTSYINSALFPIAAAKRVIEEMTGGSSGESDLKPINPLLNSLFSEVIATEGKLAASLPNGLPFGLSALCLAQKR